MMDLCFSTSREHLPFARHHLAGSTTSRYSEVWFYPDTHYSCYFRTSVGKNKLDIPLCFWLSAKQRQRVSVAANLSLSLGSLVAASHLHPSCSQHSVQLSH